MTHSVCVPSPILNGSCKAASPRCEPAVSGESRCFDADDELRLGPKCGTLGASGSLRRTFTTSASSVAGAARGSLASSGSSRGTFFRVLRKMLVLRAALWLLLVLF